MSNGFLFFTAALFFPFCDRDGGKYFNNNIKKLKSIAKTKKNVLYSFSIFFSTSRYIQKIENPNPNRF